jgi:hypothetical protein
MFNELLNGLCYLDEYLLNVKNKHEVYDISRFAATPFGLKLPTRTSHKPKASEKKKENSVDKTLRANKCNTEESVVKVKKNYVEVDHKRYDSDEFSDPEVKFSYNGSLINQIWESIYIFGVPRIYLQ